MRSSDDCMREHERECPQDKRLEDERFKDERAEGGVLCDECLQDKHPEDNVLCTECPQDDTLCGEVIKLDRGFPLVRFSNGHEVRCEHATDIKKTGETRAVIGDIVRLATSGEHDKAIIAEILPRRSVFVRKDPSERAIPQVLAANFDVVIVAQPIDEVNMRRLERELVLAHETGVRVVVVLTKADRAQEQVVTRVRRDVEALAGAQVPVLVVSQDDKDAIARLRARVPAGVTAVLIGRSGVGKSSLVNLLVGREVQLTQKVREGDGKGRHTTVNREIVDIPGAGRVVDMPGVRGLGMWEADAGIGAAFSDIEDAAARCKFRDCTHGSEPGCAVRAAVEVGEITQERLDSYRNLKQETRTVRRRKEESRWRKR